MQSHVIESGGASLSLLHVESLREVREAFFDPGTEGKKCGVRELMGGSQSSNLGIAAGKRSQQQRATLEGRSMGIRQFDSDRLFADGTKPIGDQRRDFLGGVGGVCRAYVVAAQVPNLDVGSLR